MGENENAKLICTHGSTKSFDWIVIPLIRCWGNPAQRLGNWNAKQESYNYGRDSLKCGVLGFVFCSGFVMRFFLFAHYLWICVRLQLFTLRKRISNHRAESCLLQVARNPAVPWSQVSILKWEWMEMQIQPFQAVIMITTQCNFVFVRTSSLHGCYLSAFCLRELRVNLLRNFHFDN